MALERLSVTDVECYWKKNKQHYTNKKQIPIQDYCHVNAIPMHVMSDERKRKIQTEICKLLPNSAFVKNKKRYEVWKKNNDISLQRYVLF